MTDKAGQNSLKIEVLDMLQRWQPENVNDLMTMLREKRGIETTVTTLSMTLKELRAEGKLDLQVAPSHYSNLAPFLRDWTLTKDFWAIIASVVVLDLAVLLATIAWLTPLRLVLGIIAILFFPGYSIQMCLFPDVSELLLWKRILLGIGLSIAVTGFYAVILDATTQGIALGSVLIVFTLHTLIFSWIGLLRRFEAQQRRA